MAQSESTETLKDLFLEAPFNTDIWKKPPKTDVFSAPTRMLAEFSLSRFRSAQITFGGAWEHQYDQGGVLLSMTNRKDESTSWIKAGVEKYNDVSDIKRYIRNSAFADGQEVPRISFVGCDRFADWSVHPLRATDAAKVTIELRREGDENGTALWAYELLLAEDGSVAERFPIRECTWLWNDLDSKTVAVGAYCARPAKTAGSGASEDPLKVHFVKLEVQMST